MTKPSFVVIFAVVALDFLSPTNGQVTEYTPFKEPGVIYPGIDIKFIINAAGGLWSKPRMVDSIAYACSDILPTITSAIPEFPSEIYSPVCSKVEDAVDDAGEFDAVTLCNSVFLDILSLIPVGEPGDRKRRQMNPELEILEIIPNLVKEIYGVDLDDLSTLCPNAEHIFFPSIPAHVAKFASGFMTTDLLLSLGKSTVCDNFEELTSNPLLGPDASDVFSDLARIGAEAIRFSSRESVCEELEVAISAGESAQKELAETIVVAAFKVFTEADQCKKTSSETIEALKPLIPFLDDLVSGETLNQYTGFDSVDEICDSLGTSFKSYNPKGDTKGNAATPFYNFTPVMTMLPALVAIFLLITA